MNDWKGLAEVAKLVDVYKDRTKSMRVACDSLIQFETKHEKLMVPSQVLAEAKRLRREYEDAVAAQRSAGEAVLSALERC